VLSRPLRYASGMEPEAWLRGPLPDVDPYLMPAAHALVQSGEDLALAVDGLGTDELWARPGGAASVGFHLKHIPGALDRLLTYARGEMLDDAQRAYAKAEGAPEGELAALLRGAQAGIERALAQIRAMPRGSLLDARPVGRAGLPTTVLGLIFHAAEHTQRHTGQVIATAKAVRRP
jgi:uncharacterized damage-inducible protein DinB